MCSKQKAGIERYENYQIYITPPPANDSSAKNSTINFQLSSWNKKHGKGIVFDSSAGFYLPDRSMPSPDAAWISNDRRMKIEQEEKNKFAHIAPDFSYYLHPTG